LIGKILALDAFVMDECMRLVSDCRRFAVRVRNHAKMVDCYLTTFRNNKGLFGDKKKVAQDIIGRAFKFLC
jgi:hypothetical protein